MNNVTSPNTRNNFTTFYDIRQLVILGTSSSMTTSNDGKYFLFFFLTSN